MHADEIADLHAGSSHDSETVSITVNPNIAPSVTASTSLTYTEGDGQVVIDPGMLVSDADDVNLESATVRRKILQQFVWRAFRRAVEPGPHAQWISYASERRRRGPGR